jgi:hypothetical protein
MAVEIDVSDIGGEGWADLPDGDEPPLPNEEL